MSTYRLSLLRQKGWIRCGLAGAVMMIPIAVIEHALGYFSDGVVGLRQALEFVCAGSVLAMILGILGGWVVRGFAVRVLDEDEREAERPASAKPGYGGSSSSAGAGRGGGPGHPSGRL